MERSKLLSVLLAMAVMGTLWGMTPAKVFADERGRGRDQGSRNWGHSGRERTEFRGERFEYQEGRFYRPSLFGFILDLVLPPRGVVVTYLPSRSRVVIARGITYYEYDNVYYQPCPGGYMVVDAPVVTSQYISPNVVYAPSYNVIPQTTQPQPSNMGTVVVNVPTATRGTIAITLVRYSNGFVGPQGEFYPTFPSMDELGARYGR